VVVAVEPERRLRARARYVATAAPVPVRVVDRLTEELRAEDLSFDAGVTSLVLCRVPDLAATLRELHRVIRPGGEYRIYEHVRARRIGLLKYQRMLERLGYGFVLGGDHLTRDIRAAIEDAGFAIMTCSEFDFPETVPPMPFAPKILGAATRI
jgi:SAM-dependent methyltransferase